jgi:hypothetical protein
MYPGLTGVIEFLNMFAKMLASPTGVGLPIDPHKFDWGGRKSGPSPQVLLGA